MMIVYTMKAIMAWQHDPKSKKQSESIIMSPREAESSPNKSIS